MYIPASQITINHSFHVNLHAMYYTSYYSCQTIYSIRLKNTPRNRISASAVEFNAKVPRMLRRYSALSTPPPSTTAAAVVAVVRTRPRTIPLAMITMRKSVHGFPSVSFPFHIWDGYGAPLGTPSGRRSSALSKVISLDSIRQPTIILSLDHKPKKKGKKTEKKTWNLART